MLRIEEHRSLEERVPHQHGKVVLRTRPVAEARGWERMHTILQRGSAEHAKYIIAQISRQNWHYVLQTGPFDLATIVRSSLQHRPYIEAKKQIGRVGMASSDMDCSVVERLNCRPREICP